MEKITKLRTLATLFACSLALSGTAASSAVARSNFDAWKAQPEDKLAPALRQELESLTRHPQYDHPIPVIVKLKPGVLEARLDPTQRASNALPLIGAHTARLTARQIRTLVESDELEYVTVDAVIRTTGKPLSGDAHDTPTVIGAPLVHDLGYKGGGVTIAVFDSGINPHADMPVKSRVRVSMDFTSGEPVQVKPRGAGYWENPDRYGHGTHIAGTLGGDGKKSKRVHQGVAPKAKLVDIKVVGAEGTGFTSNLIKAIDWVIANREKYEIRVANLSLGHPPMESYVNDPLGQAVERMVSAGIVTVASAGNFGSLNGHKVWGGISSPGNHPAVITVSAANTMGTNTHSDDTATSFSSRGPTFVDEIFKPNLTAPGTAVTSIYDPDSWIARNYPDLKVDAYYMRLSGSSMATAHVAGTVALMLSANPDLTPRSVKALLMLTAIKLREPHMLEQGNGMVNAYGATMAAVTLSAPDRAVVDGFNPVWELDGEEVWAGGAFAVADRIVYSGLVVPEARGQLWGSGVDWCAYLAKQSDSIVDPFFSPESGLWYASHLSSDALFWVDGIFWADGVFWIDGVFWVDGTFWVEGLRWSDSLFMTSGLMTHDYAGE